MISKEDKDFLHIHPIKDDRYLVYAETLIKKPGIYRMWVQFKIDGVVHTADFTVNVAKNENADVHKGHGGHHH